MALLRVPANAVGFGLRQRLRWSRGDACLRDEAKSRLFDWLDAPHRAAAAARAEELARCYDLGALRQCSRVLTWAENLMLLDGLERLVGERSVPRGDDGVVRAVDVGCGVFQYATALQRFLARGGGGPPRSVALCGIEVDAHGIYRDGHSRLDHARAHAHLAGAGVQVQAADFCALPLPPQDVVTVLFPFLSRYALLRWGLPLSLFRPRRLLARAVAAVRPGGWIFVVNQTEDEYHRLQRLLRGEPVAPVAAAPFASDLVPYTARTQRRMASLWVRRDGDGDGD